MACYHSVALLAMASAAFAAFSGCSADKGKQEEAPWELAAVGSGHIAVPRGWNNFEKMKSNMVLYRKGDGIGIPRLDETNAPLQIGLTVEKFPAAKDSIETIMGFQVKDAHRAPGLGLVGKESVEAIKLSDGSEAMLLTAEFIKEKHRRSLQMKLVAKDADSNAWIVSGHLVGGEDSKWPTAESNLAKWLRAHVTSLHWDEKKFDAEKLRAAYKNRDKD